MMSTATAGAMACARLPVRANQKPSVATASTMTMGTNTPATRSASRCTGALPVCAASTKRAICASAVSAPTRVARTTNLPLALMVAPVTASPAATSTGTLSPVTRLMSTADAPSSTTPSVAIRSPGRTTKRSPTWSALTGRFSSLPSACSTLAVSAPSASSARSALPARRLERASNQRPARMSATVVLATSRYRWWLSPRVGMSDIGIVMPRSPAGVASRAYRLQPYAAVTPTDTSVSMLASAWRRFFHAVTWKGHADHAATGVANTRANHCQPRNCSAGIIDSSSTGTPRSTATVRRRRRSAMRASAGSARSSPMGAGIAAP